MFGIKIENRKALKNVHGRLQVVMRCILDDDAGNNKVEQKRGKLFRDMPQLLT